ncbi:MAG TPA: metallophosphoesterase, partial [Polyangiaceae bacterium]|nr:metallophosphoesterase [Polyangiaceae bacterium]
MAQRTFAIGDIHGETKHLYKLMSTLPKLDAEDTVVFLGDYVDRGPQSAQVVDFVRSLPGKTPAKVVALRGNHEDAWLRVIDRGWDEFVTPPGNGC